MTTATSGSTKLASPLDAADQPEAAPPGSWADPNGPGRCARCKLWLTDDSCIWTVRQRRLGGVYRNVVMCLACTEAVLKVWSRLLG